MDAPEKTSCKSNLEPPSPTPSRPPPAIFSLPNELLVAIAAVGQEGRIPDRARGGDFKPEWTLSHVSRRFRDVIIGAPILWSFIEADGTHEGSVETMKLYLARSGGCKIRVNLCDLSRMAVDRDLVAGRFSNIVPHIHRIWRLGIGATEFSIDSMLAVFRDVAAPVLQDLEIGISTIYNYPRCSLDMFCRSLPPALTSLKMIGFVPGTPLPQWMASLTHLELRKSDYDIFDGHRVFVGLPTQCPALIHLVLDMNCWSSHSVMDRISIPSLKTLRMILDVSADDSHLSDILDVFDTPALTDLIIENTHGDQICVLFNPNTLPNSTFSCLTSLSFVGKGCRCQVDPHLFEPPPIRSPPLRLFPALSSLTLINQCFTANIIEQILGSASQPWPLLGSITLCPKKDALDNVYDALLDVIRSRHHDAQTIPKFRLSPVLFEKSNWDEHGVDVELSDPTEIVGLDA
ncbi:hypothetical protein FB451DRAFT_130309 [Mycena latifolia]|nr:hypothetical protein FB451DRAFT_130309 [Mycena latifolia]